MSDEVDARFETTHPSRVLKDFPSKESPVQDPWMKHFMSQTWKIQGPDFENNILQNMQRLTKESMFTALPPIDTDTVVIIGAGPSLKKNVHLLKDIPEDWVIIATDRTLKDVLKYTTPYLVTNLEATIESLRDIEAWWKDIDTSRLRLLTVPFADPGMFDLWRGDVYFINALQTSRQLLRLASKIEWKTGVQPIITGTNVGITSMIFSVHLLRMKEMNRCERTPVRVAMIGMDHVFYEDNLEVNMNVNDVDGTDCWVPWNFFIGQFEARFFAREYRKRGVQFINCTQGGILYSKDIFHTDFQTFIEHGVDGDPEDTYPGKA